MRLYYPARRSPSPIWSAGSFCAQFGYDRTQKWHDSVVIGLWSGSKQH